MLRKQFLKEHKPVKYQYLLMTEQLEMQNQMKWIGSMNNIKAYAEEIMLKERVYVSRKGSRKAALWQSKNRVLSQNVIECKKPIGIHRVLL